MAIDLTIRETKVFKELTGASWTKAQAAFQPKFCQGHRLVFNGCKACTKVEELLCPEHLDQFQDCTNGCDAGTNAEDDWLAAAVYISRCRDGETRTFEEYADQTTYGEMVQAIRDMGKAEPGASTPNTRRGSRRSSTGSRG